SPRRTAGWCGPRRRCTSSRESGIPRIVSRAASTVGGKAMLTPDPAPTIESLLTHADWLTALARSLVADRASADDLVQEAGVAALRHPPREGRSLRAWFTTVARRLARTREPLRQHARELAHRRVEHPATDDVVARIEQERRLAELVLELSEPYRRVV